MRGSTEGAVEAGQEGDAVRAPDPKWLRRALAAACIAMALAVGSTFRPARVTLPPAGMPPAVAQRVPVLLVPGWTDGPVDLFWLRGRFVEAGWPEDHVVVVEFEEPWGGGPDRIPALRSALRDLVAATGANEVDVVAHSMGGLATRVLLGMGKQPVRRVVFFATPHFGSLGAWFAFGPAAEDLRPGSDFVRRASERSLPVPALDIVAAYDLRVLPPASTRVPGAVTIEVCCPGHKGLLFDKQAFEAAAAFLSPPDVPDRG